jgi:hypothetical protein
METVNIILSAKCSAGAREIRIEIQNVAGRKIEILSLGTFSLLCCLMKQHQ